MELERLHRKDYLTPPILFYEQKNIKWKLTELLRCFYSSFWKKRLKWVTSSRLILTNEREAKNLLKIKSVFWTKKLTTVKNRMERCKAALVVAVLLLSIAAQHAAGKNGSLFTGLCCYFLQAKFTHAISISDFNHAISAKWFQLYLPWLENLKSLK